MALANPDILNYKPFYIQYGSNSTATDTRTQWGLIAKSNPYPALPTPKSPYKNEWHDQNGDEEYVSAMKYESFEFSVSFYIKAKSTVVSGSVSATAEEVIRTYMASFFNAIKEGSFKVYDAYTGLGRQSVRYAGYDEDTFLSRRAEGSDRSEDWAYAIFTVKFKCNDPTTFCRLSNNAITAIV